MNLFTKQNEVADRYGDKVRKVTVPRISTIVIATLLLLTILFSFSIIPTGYTGVRTTFGQINQDVVQAGFNWKIPFVQRIEKVCNKQQDVEFASKDVIWAETSEKVPVYMASVVVTYQINAEKSAWIFANVSDYRSSLVSTSIVSSALKEASVGQTTENVTNRGLIEPAAKEELQQALDEKYGKGTVMVINVVINNMDFEQSYNDAINARSLATKTQETQKIENETNIARAEAEAKSAKITAQGIADAKLVSAEADAKAKVIAAEAEATANERLSSSLSEQVLKNRYYEKWNGQLPNFLGSDSDLLPIADVTKTE